MVFQQIKVLFLSIIGILRRMCCFARRRKPSCTMDTLECIKVVTPNSQPKRNNYVERDWNSWDDTPQTVEEHIEAYRKRMAMPPPTQQPPEEPEQDLFSELTPVIKPQQKFYLEDNNTKNNNNDFSRLEAITDVPIAVNAELEDWEEGDAGGWDELDTEKTKELIREKRRELRQQRQKKAKGIDRGIGGPTAQIT